MKTKEEVVENAKRLKSFLDEKFHTTEDIISMVSLLTGVIFTRDHPMFNFYEAPASSKFHGCFKGGLALHSLWVYYSSLRLAAAFDINVENIDANACIFHDLVKVNLYQPLTIGSGYTYNKDVITLPHGSESLRRIKQYNIPISSEAWEIAIAYHMGAFEHDNIDMYSRGCDKYPEVLLLHTADMMATKIYKN